MTTEDRRKASLIRMQSALDHVQNAQAEIGRAIAELSSIIGLIPEGERLGKLYDKIHAEWYRVSDRRMMIHERRRPKSGDESFGLLDREPDDRDFVCHSPCGLR